MNHYQQDVGASQTEDLSPGLLRQRRNLMITSVLMPLFLLSGASLEEITLLGTKIAVENPSVIYVGISVIFAYTFIRYYQYYLRDPAARSIWRAYACDVNTAEIAYFKRLIEPRARCFQADYLFPEFRRVTTPNSAPEMLKPRLFDDEAAGFLRRYRVIDMNGMDSRFAVLKDGPEAATDTLSEREIQEVTKFWRFIERHPASNRTEPIFTTSVRYWLPRVVWLRWLVFVNFIFNRTFFTDYQLPLIVAVLSLVATVVGTFFL
jgi:hypothetical protein